MITKIELWDCEGYAKGITRLVAGFSPIKTFTAAEIIDVDDFNCSIKPTDDFYMSVAQQLSISVISDDVNFWERLFSVNGQSFPNFSWTTDISAIVVCVYDDAEQRIFDGLLQRDGRSWDAKRPQVITFSVIDFMFLIKFFSNTIQPAQTVNIRHDMTWKLQDAVNKIYQDGIVSNVDFLDPPAATINIPETTVFDNWVIDNINVLHSTVDSGGQITSGRFLSYKWLGNDNDFSFYFGYEIEYTVPNEVRYLWVGCRIRVVDQSIYSTDFKKGYAPGVYPPYNNAPISYEDNKTLFMQNFYVDFNQGTAVYKTSTGAEWWLGAFKSESNYAQNLIKIGAKIVMQGLLSIKEVPLNAGAGFTDRLKLYLALCNWKLTIKANRFKIISGGELYGAPEQLIQLDSSAILSLRIGTVPIQEYPYQDGALFDIIQDSYQVVYKTSLSYYYANFLSKIAREYEIEVVINEKPTISNILSFQIDEIDHRVRIYEVESDQNNPQKYKIKAYNVNL